MKKLASGRYTLGVQVVQRRVRRLAEHVRAQLIDRDEAGTVRRGYERDC